LKFLQLPITKFQILSGHTWGLKMWTNFPWTQNFAHFGAHQQVATLSPLMPRGDTFFTVPLPTYTSKSYTIPQNPARANTLIPHLWSLFLILF
jgi:hypothetical protein